jgi:cell division protease FtsH
MATNEQSQNPQQEQSPKKLPPFKTIGGWLLVAATISLLGMALTAKNAKQVPYSQFLQQVKAGQVEEATIGPEKIQYQLKSSAVKEAEASPNRVTQTVPMDDDLPELLEQHEVEFSAAPQSNNWWLGMLSWILLPLLFLGLGYFLVSRQQAAGGGPAALAAGKSKARIYSQGKTGVQFSDVAGVNEAVEELQEVVDFLKYADKYRRVGAKIPKGVLLTGPPGTGKTLLAKAVAGEADVPFYSISGSEFIEMFVGVGASRVRDLFQQAKQNAPCIVFIDELDTLGQSRGGSGMITGSGGNYEQEQTLNQLLNEMDGFDPNSGVIVLAATNRPEVLDPALQRPGRFDRRILVDRPDKQGRKAILNVHLPNVRLADDVDIDTLASRTSGFVGADLANLVNEAALLAARQNRNAVTMADFNEAIERVVAGLEKKSRVLNEQEKNTVAYHEVGHAMVGSLMPGAGQVEKISIVPRGMGALGYTLQMPEEDRFLMAEDELRGRIAIMLAGRSAEELIFGKVSTGATDDIQRATDLAERCVTLYGMSDKLGPISFEKPQQQFLPGTSPRRAVGPKVTEAIDNEVKAIVDGAHHMALKLLKHNRELLSETAQMLLKEEVLESDALARQLERIETLPEVDEWLRTGKLPQDEPLLQDELVGDLKAV